MNPNQIAAIPEICNALAARDAKQPRAEDGVGIIAVAHALRGEGFDASEDGTGRGTPLVPVCFDTTQITNPKNRSQPQPGMPCHTLAKGQHAPAVAYRSTGNDGARETGDKIDTLTTGTDPNGHILLHEWAVRRLTPTECERLMGFADDHTLVPYRGRMMADGPRYKMLGNSFAINCLRWIGKRMQIVNGMIEGMQK